MRDTLALLVDCCLLVACSLLARGLLPVRCLLVACSLLARGLLPARRTNENGTNENETNKNKSETNKKIFEANLDNNKRIAFYFINKKATNKNLNVV